MDFSQIQHGNIQIGGLMSNPDFADFLGDDFKTQNQKHKPKDDAQLLVRFLSMPVLLSYASEQMRKPKVVQSDFVAIRLDEYNEHIAEVGFERDPFGKAVIIGGEHVPTPLREEYLSRFPKAWEVYQRQFERAEGTPLSQLKGIDISDIAQLGFYKIGTIEALADATDRLFYPSGSSNAILDITEGGISFLELREAARRHIKENGEFESIVQAKAEAEAEAVALREVVARLKAELAASGPSDKERIAIHNEQSPLDAQVEARAKAEKRR